MTELETLTQISAQLVELAKGVQFIMLVLGAFLFWKVISIVWHFFAGWIFGGV